MLGDTGDLCLPSTGPNTGYNSMAYFLKKNIFFLYKQTSLKVPSPPCPMPAMVQKSAVPPPPWALDTPKFSHAVWEVVQKKKGWSLQGVGVGDPRGLGQGGGYFLYTKTVASHGCMEFCICLFVRNWKKSSKLALTFISSKNDWSVSVLPTNFAEKEMAFRSEFSLV